MANPYTSQSAGFGQFVDPEQQAIERQRQMAMMLRQQSMEQDNPNQVVAGRVVPYSVTQGLAKLLQGYSGRKGLEDADARQVALQQRQGQELGETLTKYREAVQGTPERQVQSLAPTVGNHPNNPNTMTVSGQPGNPQAGMEILAQSKNPMIQQLYMSQMLRGMEPGKFDTTPRYDQKGNAFVLNERGEKKYLEGVAARDKLENVNGVWVNPYSTEAKGVAPQDPNKAFFYGPDGKVQANPQFQKYEIGKSRAGAANVSVNTATKPFLNDLGKGAAEAVNTAFTAAQSAAGTLNNVNQIRSSLDKAIVGPAANARVSLAQLGEALGVGGANTTEQLQNTRNVIQGLARQELSAAGQMKGQGQITEAERGILKRAEAGDIASMTKPEIQTFLNAIEKTANYRIGIHNKNMERIKRDPNAAGVVDFMSVDVPSVLPSGQGTGEFEGFGIRKK